MSPAMANVESWDKATLANAVMQHSLIKRIVYLGLTLKKS
jgi:hypothetical protein